MSIDWRISLVPAPAVIPAPGVYTNIAAVKTLVVDHRSQRCPGGGWWGSLLAASPDVQCYPRW